MEGPVSTVRSVAVVCDVMSCGEFCDTLRRYRVLLRVIAFAFLGLICACVGCVCYHLCWWLAHPPPLSYNEWVDESRIMKWNDENLAKQVRRVAEPLWRSTCAFEVRTHLYTGHAEGGARPRREEQEGEEGTPPHSLVRRLVRPA